MKDEELVADSQFWSLIEIIYDFVLCFDVETGQIIRKHGFDKVCIKLDSHVNYYKLIEEYMKEYVNFASIDEFSEKTSFSYLTEHKFVKFVGLENIEECKQHWYEYSIVKKDNIGAMFIKNIHNTHCRMLELEQVSSKDYLTGLTNRRSFDEQVDDLIYYKKKFALLFIDVDDFKYINDNCGHDTGDCVLTEIANILERTLPSESIIARYGGDEFAIVIIGKLEMIELQNYLDSILGTMGHKLECGVETSLSIGVSFYPADGKTRKSLLRAADTALFNAKRKGKKKYIAAGRLLDNRYD